ncbi:piggyBac transposable element-derived protein 4-like [Trichomycterus rosablanca]|uniref:piggyBac transposable element-derived protein 4-like n=1 Tax=Trichomycterus rosablanca TaxID=2290929 RepID=UPI002F3562FE
MEMIIPKFLPKRLPGLQLLSNTVYSPLQLFQLFFSTSVVKTIVDNTNKYAEIRAAANPSNKWIPLSVREFYKFIALVIYMGIVKLKSVADYWSGKEYYRLHCTTKVMTGKRFLAISSNLHLCDPKEDKDNTRRKGTPAYDKLFKLKPLYTELLTACRTYFQPDKDISIESKNLLICISKARIGLKQYMKGYHLYTDHFYTSPMLYLDLLKKETLACGTIRTNRKGYPRTKINDLTRQAKRGTIRWHRRGQLLFVKWMDTREVVVCSTMHKAYDGDTVMRRVKNQEGQISKTNAQEALPQKLFREKLMSELVAFSEDTTQDESAAGPSGETKQCLPAFYSDDSTAGRRKCAMCKRSGEIVKTPVYCKKCNVPLCVVAKRNCFYKWHNMGHHKNL